MLNLNAISDQGTATFVKLLGRGYNETQGHLRKFLMNDYGNCIRALVDAIRRCLPELPEEELFWRLHFAMGSFVFSMASSQALTEIAFNDYDRAVDSSVVINQLIPYLAAGVAADSSAQMASSQLDITESASATTASSTDSTTADSEIVATSSDRSCRTSPTLTWSG